MHANKKHTNKGTKPTLFHEKWLKAYGLRVTARDAATGSICSVECRFCRAFGKEVNAERARKAPVAKIKFFTKPWRQDHMKSHMLTQHSERFKEYSAFPLLQKDSFFDVAGGGILGNQEAKAVKFFSKPVANEICINVLIDKSIVEGIIGDLLFDPDDDDTLNKERFLSVFKLQEQEETASEDAEDHDHIDGTNPTGGTAGTEHYVATVSSMVQFYSCIKMIADGLSFRQTSRVMQDMKDTLGLSALGCISPQKVSSFVRIVCAANLQTISAMLKQSWAFSIALDGGNKSDTSYLDVRIRVVSGSGILSNLHLMAIPMRDRHTGELMYDLAAKTLDNLVPDWKSRIISITTDGASSMTGQFRGVASRFGNVALPGFYRIWCALHQLDLVLQRLYTSLCDDSFVGTLTSLTGHLRRQYNLIATMGSKCPRFVNTRWMSMSKVIKWLVSNRVAVNEHMTTKTVNWAPNDAWWIVVCCLNRVMKDVDVAIASLQGKQLQVTMQRQILEGLKVDLSKIAGAGSILGPLTPAAIAPLYETRQLVPLIPTQEDATLLRESHFCNGKFAMKLDDAHKFIDNCGTFVMERLQELSNPVDGGNLSVYALVLDSVARMFVDLIQGIDSIQAERDASNGHAAPDDLIPPSTPSQLQFLSNRDFSILLQQQRERLLHTWERAEIDGLEERFDDMKRLIAQDTRIKAIVQDEKQLGSFVEAWAPFNNNHFEPLKRFFGGLATVFPGTAAVESDFS